MLCILYTTKNIAAISYISVYKLTWLLVASKTSHMMKLLNAGKLWELYGILLCAFHCLLVKYSVVFSGLKYLECVSVRMFHLKRGRQYFFCLGPHSTSRSFLACCIPLATVILITSPQNKQTTGLSSQLVVQCCFNLLFFSCTYFLVTNSIFVF